jgi:subtilase family serine protease
MSTLYRSWTVFSLFSGLTKATAGDAQGQHAPGGECRPTTAAGSAADLPMTDLILVLSRDPEQQAAFDKFVASQYDPDSPNFHQWLTPSRWARTSAPPRPTSPPSPTGSPGMASRWTKVTKDRMSIRFSGKASQVESAFHTEIHNLEGQGRRAHRQHERPADSRGAGAVVVGVKALHNFFPIPCTTWASRSRATRNGNVAAES